MVRLDKAVSNMCTLHLLLFCSYPVISTRRLLPTLRWGPLIQRR